MEGTPDDDVHHPLERDPGLHFNPAHQRGPTGACARNERSQRLLPRDGTWSRSSASKLRAGLRENEVWCSHDFLCMDIWGCFTNPMPMSSRNPEVARRLGKTANRALGDDSHSFPSGGGYRHSGDKADLLPHYHAATAPPARGRRQLLPQHHFKKI